MHNRPLVTVKHFHRLLDYIGKVGLNVDAICSEAGIRRERIMNLASDQALPTEHYSRLYETAAQAMQQMNRALPWAAGIGTDAFRFLCYSIIHCNSLREAMQRSQRFQQLLYPVSGNRVVWIENDDFCELRYEVDTARGEDFFAPANWDRREGADAIAKASGLKVWYSFIGWLIGQTPELISVRIAAPMVSPEYDAALERIFDCAPQYECAHSSLQMASAVADRPIIHSSDSLDAFLENAIHTLVQNEARPASTAEAVRSLMAKQEGGKPISLEHMAEQLHMSASSLRRRLRADDSSYQQIKDQYRRDIALRMLRDDSIRIQDISERLGFMETGSFIRSFKSWTGMTPKAWRDSLASVR